MASTGETEPRANHYAYRLEERRKVKGLAYYERKQAARKSLADAKTNANIDEKTKTQLAAYGY